MICNFTLRTVDDKVPIFIDEMSIWKLPSQEYCKSDYLLTKSFDTVWDCLWNFQSMIAFWYESMLLYFYNFVHDIQKGLYIFGALYLPVDWSSSFPVPKYKIHTVILIFGSNITRQISSSSFNSQNSNFSFRLDCIGVLTIWKKMEILIL